jgi:hypothetical protein
MRRHGADFGAGNKAIAVTIKMKVSEYLDMIDSGMGGGPNAMALAGGGSIRSLPPDAEIDVTVTVPEGFNRPMMMSGDKDGPGSGSGDKDGTPPKDPASTEEPEIKPVEVEKVEADLTVQPDKPSALRMSPEKADTAVAEMKATGRLTGDMDVLDQTVSKAKAGQDGSLGELEAIQRWLDEGATVEVLPEVQNSGLKNPDYRVNGKIREVKSRSTPLADSDWIKKKIQEANSQVKKSGTGEKGEVELQLRGDDFGDLTVADIENQLRDFNPGTNRSLDRVAIYRDGQLFAEWIRAADGTVSRIFP